MMAVDASALAAIFFMEADAPNFLRALQQTPHSWISAANYLEVAIILDNRGELEQMASTCFWQRPRWRSSRSLPNKHASPAMPIAGSAGAITGRPQLRRLLPYALAKERDLPLLFKADDFAQTDLRPAL